MPHQWSKWAKDEQMEQCAHCSTLRRVVEHPRHGSVVFFRKHENGSWVDTEPPCDRVPQYDPEPASESAPPPSRRELFAGMVLQALVTRAGFSAPADAKTAVQYADALLAELAKRPSQSLRLECAGREVRAPFIVRCLLGWGHEGDHGNGEHKWPAVVQKCGHPWCGEKCADPCCPEDVSS